MSSEGFRIEVVSGDGSGAPTLVVSGELDMASAPSLLGTVETIRPLRHRLILDTAAVSFIDSFGLRTLLAVREATSEDGQTFVLRSVPPLLQSVLEIAGLVDAFEIEPLDELARRDR